MINLLNLTYKVSFTNVNVFRLNYKILLLLVNQDPNFKYDKNMFIKIILHYSFIVSNKIMLLYL